VTSFIYDDELKIIEAYPLPYDLTFAINNTCERLILELFIISESQISEILLNSC